MAVEITLFNAFEPVIVDGTFDKLAGEINLQMVQGKQLVALQQLDGQPIGINVNNINTIRPQTPEDAFSTGL